MSRLDRFIRKAVLQGAVQFGPFTSRYPKADSRFASAHGLRLVKNYTDRWHLITNAEQIQLSLWTSIWLDIARAYACPNDGTPE